jgi:hypothetical protein
MSIYNFVTEGPYVNEFSDELRLHQGLLRRYSGNTQATAREHTRHSLCMRSLINLHKQWAKEQPEPVDTSDLHKFLPAAAALQRLEVDRPAKLRQRVVDGNIASQAFLCQGALPRPQRSTQEKVRRGSDIYASSFPHLYKPLEVATLAGPIPDVLGPPPKPVPQTW